MIAAEAVRVNFSAPAVEGDLVVGLDGRRVASVVGKGVMSGAEQPA
jgi:hypothetical protein